ncbi:hypothetical protein SUSAZ_08105 [Sulfolobus acidocaldarius SUSAZ]|nr:hypothetical protein SUSAZ_08105 [Sulfolobus acidocaldarius SUSAZ]
MKKRTFMYRTIKRGQDIVIFLRRKTRFFHGIFFLTLAEYMLKIDGLSYIGTNLSLK